MKVLIFGAFMFFALLFVLIAYSCCVVASNADDQEEMCWDQNAEHCVVCGRVIPEGRMVCWQCDMELRE